MADDNERPSPENDHLEADENQDARARASPNVGIVYETIRGEGEHELGRGARALFWSGLAAGLSMGFSLVTEAALQMHLPEADWTPIVAKLGYSVGFLIVILGRQQLFTENTLTPILQLLERRNLATLGQVAKLWLIVLAANLVGAFIFALLVGHTSAFKPGMQEAMNTIAHEAMAGDFVSILMKGVFAGWLIALIIWLMPFAETARVAVIIIITYVVGLAGFAHVIVGSIEGLYLVVTLQMPLLQFFGGFFLPALIGNVLGGVSMVAVVNYAQVDQES